MYQKTKKSIDYHQDRLNHEKLSFLSKIAMAVKLFSLYMIHSILHSFALLFSSPEKCFAMATNQDLKGTWSKSYYKHLLFQRRVRLYSTTSFFVIVISVVSAALAFNIIFPPTEIKFANAAGTTYTVTNTDDTSAAICIGDLSFREVLNCVSSGDTINITATGTLTLGATLNMVDGVTVNSNSNFIIDGAAVNPTVWVNGISNATLNHLVVVNASAFGIMIDGGSSDIVVDHCDVSQSGSNGLVVDANSTHATINDCTISNSVGDGIKVSSSTANTITNNTSSNNGGNGINLSTAANTNAVTGNNLSGNSSYGLNIESSSNSNSISDNNATNNTLSSLRIIQSNDNTIDSNVLNTSTNGSGISLSFSPNNNITNNTFSGNGVYGINIIDSSNNNTLSGNTLSGNTSGGGHVAADSNSNYFYHNIVNQSLSFSFDGGTETILNSVIYSSQNNKLFIDLSNPLGSVSQIALGVDGQDLQEYLGDLTLTNGEYSGQIDLTEDQENAYSQICALVSDLDNSTFSSSCSEMVADDSAPTLSLSASDNVVTATATDLNDLGESGDPLPLIYYTTDGNTPTLSSTQYVSPVTMSAGSTFKALSIDWVDNQSAVSTMEIEEEDQPDTVAPTISNVKASGLTATTATITWLTNEAATSQVLYGTSENNLHKAYTNTNLVTSHSVQLIILDPDTKYYYKVKSADSSGNMSVSEIKSFTTQTDTVPVIINPEDGAIVYARRPVISGTAPVEASLNLYIDQIYHQKTVADKDGKFSMSSKNKLTADEHIARVKNNDSGERSSKVTFTVATVKTTDQILINIDNLPADSLNTTLIKKPALYGNFYHSHYSLEELTVQIFIDDELNGAVNIEDMQTTDNSQIASFIYEPFLDLSPGVHEAYIKVIKEDGSSQQIIEDGEINARTFNYYAYSAASALKYQNNKILANVRSEAYARLYINDTAYDQVRASQSSTGTSGISFDVSGLSSGTYQARIDVSEYEGGPYKPSQELSFNVLAPLAIPVTTPVSTPDPIIKEEVASEEQIIIEEEIIVTEELEVEKDLELIQEILEEEAAKTEKPRQYPIIGEVDVELTPLQEKELKEDMTEAIEETKVGMEVSGQEQGAVIDPATGEVSFIIEQSIDIASSFREVFTGEIAPEVSRYITFEGTIPLVDSAKGYAILTVKSDPIVRIAEADENGQWTLSVPVDYLPEGEHTAFLQTEVNGVKTDQIEIARFVLQEKQRFSSTTIFFLVNIALAIFALLLAIFLQLRKNRKLIEQMNNEAI